MSKLTPFEADILARTSTYTKSKNDSAEMYSNSVCKQKQKKKQNTFQQSTPTANNGNVWEASPPSLASPGASHLGVKEEKEPKALEKKKSRGRKLVKDDLLVDINCLLGKIRTGRYDRLTAYFSIKTDTDIRYQIFLRASMTTALDEVLRGIRKTDNKPLMTIAKDYINTYPNNLMLGRIRYTPIGGYVTEQHRSNLKHALFAIWEDNGLMKGELYLNGEYYSFIFNDDLTPAQMSANYKLTSNWQRYQDTEFEGFDDEE